MKTKDITCVVCPLGCHLRVSMNGSGYQVQGQKCAKGKAYAIDELTHPVRTITTTVTVVGDGVARLPVRTNKAFPKDRMLELMKVLKTMQVAPPIRVGQVILENALDTGVNVVASRTLAVEKSELRAPEVCVL